MSGWWRKSASGGRSKVSIAAEEEGSQISRSKVGWGEFEDELWERGRARGGNLWLMKGREGGGGRQIL